MSKNIYEDLAVIDKKIGEILNKMPASSFDKVDIKKELPIFSFFAR